LLGSTLSLSKDRAVALGCIRHRTSLFLCTLAQALVQAALPPQSPLQPLHLPVVVLVIVPQKVQETVKSEHP
jgi:hypothetical protein